MDRAEAQKIVDTYVFKVEQYRAVSHMDALKLLGENRFGRLMDDAIRGVGPTKDTIYPWNVVDYMLYKD